MMKKLLSRFMDGTKRKRSTAKRQRGLAFEQMEDRLALSTTIGPEIDLRIYSINTAQGGVISFYRASDDGMAFLDLSGKSFQFANAPITNSSDSYLFGENALIVGDADSLNAWQGNQESTINQPIFGDAENSNGIVAIGAIFEKQPLARGPQESNVAVARHQAAPELAPAIVPVNEISLARGREMYFDVAEVSDGESRSQTDDVSTEDRPVLTRISFNSLAKKHEQVRTAATTNVSVNKTTRLSTLRGVQADALRTSTPSLKAVPTVSEAELPALPQENSPQGDKVSATSARDQAFADWRRREFLDSDGILSASTDESDEDSSSWPILAALAVGGLVVRTRRLAGSSLWHQQPPRRKKPANL